ncbi:dihydrodipicolinate synthase family protein [Aspergillus clavatus NRRL 1]|uniref:Dihydrodipicolinate synthetase family protein n=1 Tax=Aspergillus clavatus (strain ATCC 1007 / CBS 513.65 / DSM 816 / NCTC 3887 / NRRL 1 / QM 1276 / 107) TaxID=344612 RepID=A1CHI0_ASPCL|nr:dihydrodipicolinate synthetase family protein [Aspergillus clavatus NRRL 1]EAW10335.1 dihydrodipicolinate synthetase family protein [Aspergillus clavatus NRRL 1]
MPSNTVYPGGIHVPSLTFFQDNPRQDIDWATQEKHLTFLIQSGLHGIVLAGSNGEAVTLSTAEKTSLVNLTRTLATRLNRPSLTITLGCSGQATRAVIDETVAAHHAGADFALVLVPSYFHFAMDAGAILAFFTEVADHSPLPVMLYNYPGVAAGLDLDSEILVALSRHPNIAGVKLTCGGIGKVPRVTAAAEPPFAVLSGQIDWMGPAMAVGAIGAITGMANLYPRTCVELYELYKAGKTQEATELQLQAATAEWAFAKGGINGSKWVVAKMLGYPETSAACRRPYPLFADASKQKWMLELAEKLKPVEEGLASRAA